MDDKFKVPVNPYFPKGNIVDKQSTKTEEEALEEAKIIEAKHKKMKEENNA